MSVNVIEVERGWVDAFSTGNFSLADESFHEDAVIYINGGRKRDLTWPEFKEVAQAIKAAYPDLTLSIDSQFIANDRVMYYWSAAVSHDGSPGEFDPTGKKARLKGLVISRVNEGKVVERWEFWDHTWPLDHVWRLPADRS